MIKQLLVRKKSDAMFVNKSLNMIKYPGAYLITKCESPNCPFRELQIYIFLGLGKFDVAYIKKYSICGGCKHPIRSISNIAFYNCQWLYAGVSSEGESLVSPPQKSGSEFSYFPLKDVSWSWLTIQTSNFLQPSDTKQLSDAAVQVNFPQEDIRESLVIKALTNEAERYRTKYKNLKMKISSKNIL